MKPWVLLGQTRTPDGTDLRLQRRDTEFAMFAGGRLLMSSRMHGSEEALAAMACGDLRGAGSPHVLIGGLGMGYTLRAALDLLPATATVTVAELVPAVIDWNRGPLRGLVGAPAADARVRLEAADVGAVLRAHTAAFDAILLDVDNGPDAFSTSSNLWLYADPGLAAARRALKAGGRLAVWSAWEDRRFEQRLRYAGFTVKVERVRARLKRGGPRHTIFVARSPEAEAR